MELQGVVESGMKRGQGYVAMEEYRARFQATLGFSPFPGTLNLRVDEEEKMKLEAEVGGRRIEGFEKSGEAFSAVDAYPVFLDGVEAALLEMDVTDHPPEIAEFIAPVNLRNELDVEDGDTVTCRTR